MPPQHEDYPDDASDLGNPRVVHNHYEQNRNGNGNAMMLKISLAVCGSLLVGLLALNAYLWRDNTEFQRDVIDRLARVEAVLNAD